MNLPNSDQQSTLLIGEISSNKAITVCKFIKKNYPRCRIITYDYIKITITFHTKYSDEHIYIEKKDSKSYLDTILNICKNRNINHFFPVHSDFIGYVLLRKPEFETYLSYIGSYELYESLHNKKKLMTVAKELKIPIPINYKNLAESKIPFIAKPSNLSSSKGVYYFLGNNSKLINFDSNYIFQQYVDGFGCGYSVYVDNGVIVNGYGHKRIAEYPISGGSSTYRTSFYVPEMHAIAHKIFDKIPWTGFAMLEFKYTSKNELYLIEINPRIWGSINQGLQNNINYFEKILGKSNFHKKNNSIIHTYLFPQLFLSLFYYLLKGNLKPTVFFIRNVLHNKADVTIFSDFFGFTGNVLRKFIK